MSTLVERLSVHLREGKTAASAAAAEGISPALGEIIVDDMRRRGVLTPAQSLCASGLGMCSGGKSQEAKVHCAGCPLVALAPRNS